MRVVRDAEGAKKEKRLQETRDKLWRSRRSIPDIQELKVTKAGCMQLV